MTWPTGCPRMGRAFWVTHENDQSRSLLAGRDVVFVPYVRVRNVPDVVHCLPTAHRLWRERSVTRVVSTGSGIAVGYLPYLARRGVACHYVESAARVTAPSLTGQVLRWTPRIRRYTQHERWADRHWMHRGSVFDSYEPFAASPPAGDVVRVVVTLGTAREFPFRRLVEALAPLLAPHGELAARHRTSGGGHLADRVHPDRRTARGGEPLPGGRRARDRDGQGRHRRGPRRHGVCAQRAAGGPVPGAGSSARRAG